MQPTGFGLTHLLRWLFTCFDPETNVKNSLSPREPFLFLKTRVWKPDNEIRYKWSPLLWSQLTLNWFSSRVLWSKAARMEYILTAINQDGSLDTVPRIMSGPNESNKLQLTPKLIIVWTRGAAFHRWLLGAWTWLQRVNKFYTIAANRLSVCTVKMNEGYLADDQILFLGISWQLLLAFVYAGQNHSFVPNALIWTNRVWQWCE